MIITMLHPLPHKRPRTLLLLLSLYLFCILGRDVAALDWSFSTASKSSDAADPSTQDDWVSPILNREIRTRIGAHDWGPTITPYNELCEIYTLLQSLEEDSADLPIATQFLELMASPEVITAVTHPKNVVPYTMSLLSNHTSLSKASIRLLEYMVQMRMASPHCELQRTLFESIAPERANQFDEEVSSSSVTLLVYDDASRPTTVRRVHIPSESSNDVASEKDLRLWWDQVNSQYSHEESTVSSEDTSDHVLPGEVVISSSSSTTDPGTLVVLYGFLGSPLWADVYRKLRALPHLQIVVRHRGVPPSPGAPITMLQGYGVRLDIRNVEYKVFDDRSDALSIQKNDSTNGDLLNVSRIVTDRELNSDALLSSSLFQHHHPSLAGVNVTRLLEQNSGSDVSPAELLQVQTSLWKIHDAQMLAAQIVPPIWQRRQLSLQAATVISGGSDPLYTLQHLLQNLPSVASTLVHVKVPDLIVNVSTAIAQARSFQSGLIYLNGRVAASLERPTFNVFELLHQIRQEQAILGRLQSLFVEPQGNRYVAPFDAMDSIVVAKVLRDVQNAWMLGNMFGHSTDDGNDKIDSNRNPKSIADTSEPTVRIDVGRGWKQAVIYLNDVEKDPQYMSWPRSLRQMLMNMQFGMPPTVRRNIFTILAVVDPIESRSLEIEDDDENDSVGNVGFDFGMQLIQAQYPTRIGVLVTNVKDMKACSEWIAAASTPLASDTDGSSDACPVPPIFATSAIPTNPLELQDHPATTHAVHRLIASFASNDAHPPGALVAYGEYLLSSIRRHRGSLSLYDLVTIHGSLLEGMQMGTSAQGVEDGFHSLIKEESLLSTDLLYGKAVRFAVDKRLHPGMSFLNGRLLSTDQDAGETVSTTFQEEQNHVFGMIMKGDITDTSPKSIYAKLLSGAGLYQKYHPLLSSKSKPVDSDGDSPQNLQHQFSAEHSLLHACKAEGSHSNGLSDALFVVDVFLEYNTIEGLDLAAKVISLMDSFPTSLESPSGKGSNSIEMVYRFMPSSASASKSAFCSLFAHAALLGAPTIRRLLESIEVSQVTDPLDSLLSSIDDISEDIRATILATSSSEGPCSTLHYPTKQDWSIGNALVANGRVFHIEEKLVDQDDLELLLTLEISRSKAITHMLRKYVAFDNANAISLVGKVASFLTEEASSGSKRYNINESIENLSEQLNVNPIPLAFTWNTEIVDESAPLQVQVTAILDPLSEAAQRLSPLLKVIRDQLQLPLHVLLTPPLMLEGDAKIPITSYYRFVADPGTASPEAVFSHLPSNHVLTLQVDVPEPWNVQQTSAIQDTDNLRCDVRQGCSDDSIRESEIPMHERAHVTNVEYGLKNLLIFGQCYETKNGNPPNGLPLTLSRSALTKPKSSGVAELGMDGMISIDDAGSKDPGENGIYSDTLVMKNVGYWQLPANPGVWKLGMAEGSEGAAIFEMVPGSIRNGAIRVSSNASHTVKTVILKDFISKGEILLVRRRPGMETAELFPDDASVSLPLSSEDDDVIHVFSLATGHLYERFLKIMMLSVTKRTSQKVKFWLFENFLSPTFKASARAMAQRIGCAVEFVTYKWPEWLRGQSEKQRIIWGYKILFLDVLFPLSVKKIIYVDADQVVRADLKELWDMDLQGHVYGYTPFCTSRATTLGYQFWREGFWKNHLGDKPYHISALYVVDLERFRRSLVGDVLRSTYQQLSADPNSLANLDQDLPNFAQHQVPIFSLPQEWLWCESWCSDETKAQSKTIDLCNNPLHKEPKVSMAKRIISGALFNESWVELDAEVERYEQEYYASSSSASMA